LVAPDLVTRAGLIHHLPGQFTAFTIGHHPSHDVPAENIHRHVQVVVAPFDRPSQFGNVPRPNLVGTRCQQFGPRKITGCPLTALANQAVAPQEPVHRADRTEIATFVQQDGVHLTRRHVAKPLTTQLGQHLCLKQLGQ